MPRSGTFGPGHLDLRQNSVRGHLAEYIVAQALSVSLQVRSAWDDYDLLLMAC